MISLRYDSHLIEQAVRLAARRDAANEHELHCDLDPLYALPDGDDREAQFQRAFVYWFTRLRLDRPLDEMLSHFPRIVERVSRGIVRQAPKQKSEGAELFVRDTQNPSTQTLIMQVLPESIVESEPARDAMLRELQHVEDMLDETFAYVPESIEGLPSRQQIVRDRYRLFWDVHVESVLVRHDLLARCIKARLRSQFARALSTSAARPQHGAFDLIWNDQELDHPQLLAWAKDPQELLEPTEPQREAASGWIGGTPCPVCGFPTFDWTEDPDQLDGPVLQQVRASIADWTPERGICRQCAETYQSVAEPAARL